MTSMTLARLGLVCVTFAAFTAGAARAEEGVAFKNILGSMGIVPKDKDTINYRERAPLVLPPKVEQLPAPAAPETLASANPQWPNDPEVALKKRRAAEERRPATESDIRRAYDKRPELSIYEIRQGRSASAEMDPPGTYRTERVDMSNPTPAERRDTTADTGPVSRRTLADPPSEYRSRNVAAANREGFRTTSEQQDADANPINWLTRKFSHSDDDE